MEHAAPDGRAGTATGTSRRTVLLAAAGAVAVVALAVAAAAVLVRGASASRGPLTLVYPAEQAVVRSGRGQDVAFAGVALSNRSSAPVRVTGFVLGSGPSAVRPGRQPGPQAPVLFGELLVARGAPQLVPGYQPGWPPQLVGNAFQPFAPFTVGPGDEAQLVMRLGRVSAGPAELVGLTVEYRAGGRRAVQTLPLRLSFTDA